MADSPVIRVDRIEARVQWGTHEHHATFLRDDTDGCYYGVSENPDEAGKLYWQVPQNTDGRRPVPRMVTPLDEREVPHDTKQHLSQAWEGGAVSDKTEGVEEAEVVPMDRIREAFDRVGREADGEIQKTVREAVRRMTALVERAIVKSERPVYATSFPNRIQTPVGPALQVYLFHETPETGRDVDDHETSTVEVALDFGGSR